MCLDIFSEEAPCGSILVNDHLPLATTTVFLFSFFSENKRARKKSKELLSSPPTTTHVRWRSRNPPRFIFYHAHSTELEEKIEGLWTGYL